MTKTKRRARQFGRAWTNYNRLLRFAAACKGHKGRQLYRRLLKVRDTLNATEQEEDA